MSVRVASEAMLVSRNVSLPLAAFMLLAAGMAGCTSIGTDSVSIADIMSRDKWEPGEVRVDGKVINVTVERTLGQRKIVHLEGMGDPDSPYGELHGYVCSGVLVPADTEVREGQAWSGTIRFERGTFDGQPVVYSPQLVCPLWFGAGYSRIATSIATSNWIALTPIALLTDGWVRTEVHLVHGQALALRDAQVEVWRPEANDTEISAPEEWLRTYFTASVDVNYMISSSPRPASGWRVAVPPTSIPEIGGSGDQVRYEDTNGNGQLDDGDVFFVATTAATDTMSNVVLRVGDARSGVRSAAWIVTVGTLLGGTALEGIRDQSYLHEVVANDKVEARILIGDIPNQDLALDSMLLRLHIKDETHAANLTSLAGNIGPARYRVIDADGNDLLGRQDRIELNDLPVHEEANVMVIAPGHAALRAIWTTGYGFVYRGLTVAGGANLWSFNTTGVEAGSARAEMPYAHRELDFGKTLEATVAVANQTVLAATPMKAGLVGTWVGGTLWLDDKDSSGGLSGGDILRVDGLPGTPYTVTTSALFGKNLVQVELTPGL